MRTILVHVNVEVGDDYPRTPAELGSLVQTLVTTGLTDDLALDGRTFSKPTVSVPLAEEVVGRYDPQRYVVSHLQVVEQESLLRGLPEGIRVVFDGEKDSMGFDRAELSAPSREQLLDFVRANWGDDDAEWFQTWVVDRIEEVFRCEDCGKELSEEDLASTASNLCDSCEKQRNFDRAST